MNFRFDKDIKKYRIECKLGQGAYGKVYKAVDRTNSQPVALKVMKFNPAQEGVPSYAIREICFLRSLSHCHIISLKDVIFSDTKLILIFELMKYDLYSFITSSACYNEETIKRILLQVFRGLQFIHSNRIIHRDLKPQNILLDNNNNIKIADFGLSRSFQLPFKPYTKSVQTLWYRAPELLLNSKSYDTSIDIWSVGCIFAELVTGVPLFSGTSEKDVVLKIFQVLGTPSLESWPGLKDCKSVPQDLPQWSKVTLSSIFSDLDENGVSLLQGLLELNPQKRLSASEALNHVITK